ncbi:MAG: hypothetical protein K2O53_08425, partial [Bacteroidales bacterium]|nr:hypothetical protein [Bacteroidales bacterium]
MKTNSVFRWFSGIALLLGFMTQGMAQSEDYQSFFDGNPSYTQLWDMYDYKWEAGMAIKKHSLEGDTTVDGILYHILSVVGAGGEMANGYNVQFWVRESEAHDKVWVRLPWDSDGREFLAVDMNLKQGDLFPIGKPSDMVYYEVDTVYY